MSWKRFVLLQFEAKVGAEVQHRMANPDSGSLCAPHSVLLSDVLRNVYLLPIRSNLRYHKVIERCVPLFCSYFHNLKIIFQVWFVFIRR